MEKMNHIPDSGKLTKCPVCSGFLRDYGKYFACSTCYFSCGTAYLSRISAAMDLAIAAINQEKCENDPSVTLNKSRQADKDCLKAFEKVKEAFQK